MLRLLSLLIFRINGWNVEDKVIYPKKCIIIAAPHTSNWDFLIGRCYGYIQKIYPKYLIKSEVFYPIIGTLLKLNGGIPVYRNKSHNVVDQIVEKYDLPDKSKALRCLFDYVEEKDSEWDEMFATIRCNRCG